jgi:hypothetical protein
MTTSYNSPSLLASDLRDIHLSIESLAIAVKKDFTTLGMPDILEMAILSTSGKVLYSDLSKSVMTKISPFYDNLLILSPGDNMSLNVDATKTIIVSRISNLTIMIALTDKKLGIVLTKMRSVADKFGKLLDELVPLQEEKIQEVFTGIEAEEKPTLREPTSDRVAEAVEAPSPQQQAESLQVATPPVTIKLAPIPSPPVPPIVSQAKTIIDEARKSSVTLRALGGMAVALHCPSARHRALMREYPDIDLVGHAKEGKEIKKVFLSLGFEPNKRFNALHGNKRLKFLDTKSEVDVDIFLDVFQMCHKFDFKDRLNLDEYTISLADLLMTKLQIVELNEKDVRDVIAIFLDHVAGRGQEEIDDDYIAGLCGDDWGLWKTISMNCEKILEFLNDYEIPEGEKQKVKSKLASFLKRLEAEPKGTRWKMRARVGERAKWYETVEEVAR